MALRPDPVQLRALHALHEHLDDGGRGTVVFPCGGGKTLVSRWWAAQLAARVTVVFVPKQALLPQTLLAWRSDRSWRHHAMIVCSDPASGRAVEVDDLELPAWARDAVIASTAVPEIEEFLDGPGPQVIFSTYHSAPRVAEALRATGRIADVAVMDEAHNLAGRPRSEFRTVLDDALLPARRRLFLTATPVEVAAWTAEHDEDVAAPLSLDDVSQFGPKIFQATHAEVRAVGRLVDYDVQVLAVREQDTDDGRRRPTPVLAVLAAVQDGARRFLTFHSRIARAAELAELLDGEQVDGVSVRAEHIDGKLHDARWRAEALARLAAVPPDVAAVLASARTLTEGIDVPAVDVGVFADPRTSAVEIVQAAGRVMRAAPGKTRGRIIIPVTISANALDVDSELGGSAWRHVWIVLRALADMDPRFAQVLRSRTAHRGEHHQEPKSSDGPRLKVTLPDGMDVGRWTLQALDRTGAGWWAYYDVLASYTREHGAARPGRRVQRDGLPLGRWVDRQQDLYRRQVLDPGRVAALQQLAGWAWSAREEAWWEAAAAWPLRHPTGQLPEQQLWEALLDTPAWRIGVDPPASRFANLAEFAVETCARHRRGQLPEHLQRAADELPRWRWNLLPAADAELVAALARWGAQHQDLSPPHDQVDPPTGLPVGSWVTALRRRRYTGRLDAVLELEIAVLAGPGCQAFRWEAGDTAWRLGLLALRQFVARTGTVRIPTDHVERLPDHEVALFRWAAAQRFEYRQQRLSAVGGGRRGRVAWWRWEIPRRDGDRPVLEGVQHGTRRGYQSGCWCDPCTTANTRSTPGWIERGPVLVDASPAQAHLRQLLLEGATPDTLARTSGLTAQSINAVLAGTAARIRPEGAELLLGLTAAAARRSGRAWTEAVPVGPSLRLIEWMVMRGWPRAWIEREVGEPVRVDQRWISSELAGRISLLDQRMGKTLRPPPRRRGQPMPPLANILGAERHVQPAAATAS